MDVYTIHTGNGSSDDGWPSIDQWASFNYLYFHLCFSCLQFFANMIHRWNANLPLIQNSCVNIGASGPNNSPEETATVGTMIQAVANVTNVDPRFILATIMQESKGCVRVQTTYNGNSNPGLMQSHAGLNNCVGIDPCPASTINGMIQDGVGGTAAGDGLAAIMNQLQAGDATNQASFGNDTSVTQLYYRAARMYNSGSIDPSGDLGLGVATHCYASDIANRLTGWVFAPSTCTLDGAAQSNGTTNTSRTNPPAPTPTPYCITAQPGNTCDGVADELGVTTAEFLAANPSINAVCSNMLAGATYCA
jgi:hypothetical protein